MPRFKYVGRSRDGKKVSGVLVAADETDLAAKLDHQNVIYVSSQVEHVVISKGTVTLSVSQVLNFTVNLTSLLKGGLSLVQSLEALLQDTADPKVTSVVSSIKDFVSAGGSFKESLSLHPQTFSVLYRAIVESGETTGKLDTALDNIAEYIEWMVQIKGKIVEMAVYPIIVFSVMIGVVSVLVGYVIPKFQPLFRDMQIELPAATKFVLDISQIFSKTWYILFGGGIILVVVFHYLVKQPKILLWADRMKLKIPIVGDLMYKLALSRFSRAMYLCLSGGIPVLRTLEMAEEIVGNTFLGGAIRTVREGVNTGGELSAGLTLTKVFPTFLIRAVAVGERSGKLPDSFKRVYDFYDKEVPRTVQRLFSILEPLLIVFMGTIVGGIAFAVFMPLMKIMQGVAR